MQTAIISAKLSDKKKTEFFQTMEPLENLIKHHCSNYKIEYQNGGKIRIEIVFEDLDQLESNFYNNVFTILKGSIKSLCENVEIKIENELVS